MIHFGTPAIIWPHDLSVYYCGQHDRFTTNKVSIPPPHILSYSVIYFLVLLTGIEPALVS